MESGFTSMSVEDTIERLRVHGRLLTGYALGVAERAGMSPGDAADLFVLPLLAGASGVETAEPEALEHWLRSEAAAMEAVHGSVRLERDGDVGTFVIAVAEDLAWLEPWGVSPAYWAGWLKGHVRRVAARHGMSASVTLDGERLLVRFAPAG